VEHVQPARIQPRAWIPAQRADLQKANLFKPLKEDEMTDQPTLEERLREQSANLERQHLKDTVELLEALTDRFGPQVMEVVDQVVADRSHRTWEQIARDHGNNSLEELLRLIWSSETLSGGYEVTFKTQANGVMAWVLRCPVAEMARQMGVEKWANHLICKGDPFMVEGFNPRLGFRFIQSMMEGARCCQQFYFMKE
jgi:L-2-amino-thiazoline-4-carboxylic acid hydrolase